MKRTNTILSLAAAFALAAAMGACESNNKVEKKTAEAEAAAVNKSCPYSNNPANASVTRSYKGQTVAFCCAGCANRWDSATDADRDQKLASMKK